MISKKSQMIITWLCGFRVLKKLYESWYHMKDPIAFMGNLYAESELLKKTMVTTGARYVSEIDLEG